MSFICKKYTKMKKTFLLVCAIAVFASCKKNDDDTEVTLDISVTNIVGSYKIASVTLLAGGTSRDVLNDNTFFEACERDDVTAFASNGTYTITDAGVVCTPPTTDNGAYSVNVTTKTITIDGEVMKIESLTNKKIVVSKTSGSGASAITMTSTLAKQ
jgi:hypothetical protein